VFRGRRGSLLWHDGQGMCLFAKRLERGRFIWPSTIPHGDADRAVTITPVACSERCERSVLRPGQQRRAPQSAQPKPSTPDFE